jgi:hypothetical protein
VPAQIDAMGREAVQQFEAAVARLNQQAAGRSLFAGLATDGPALRPAAEILDALELAVAGATTAADVGTALDTWFGAGGGFETFAYTGSADPLRPFRISPSESADLPVTALDPAIRDTLRGLAMSALLDRGVLAGNVPERAALAGASGEALIAARDGLVSLRGVVGDTEASIERARVRNESRTCRGRTRPRRDRRGRSLPGGDRTPGGPGPARNALRDHRPPLGPVAHELPQMIRRLALLLALILVATPVLAQSVRVRDLVDFDGVRGNDLVGYGLVVGLDGSGDSLRNAPFTEEILSNVLERLGVNVTGEQLRSRNVAAVFVTAELSPSPARAAGSTSPSPRSAMRRAFSAERSS